MKTEILGINTDKIQFQRPTDPPQARIPRRRFLSLQECQGGRYVDAESMGGA